LYGCMNSRRRPPPRPPALCWGAPAPQKCGGSVGRQIDPQPGSRLPCSCRARRACEAVRELSWGPKPCAGSVSCCCSPVSWSGPSVFLSVFERLKGLDPECRLGRTISNELSLGQLLQVGPYGANSAGVPAGVPAGFLPCPPCPGWRPG
jgi:hypothetical protein